MTEVTQNVFDKGLLQDLSKYRIPNGFMLDSYQVELTNLEGSNFALTSANGNTLTFSLPNGYKPMATREYDGLLYICSINTATQNLELGTFKSPETTPNSTGVAETSSYKALRNFKDESGNPASARFTYNQLGIDTSPDYIDMVLQLDYDNTINIILVSESFQPLIINTLFEYKNKKFYASDRVAYLNTDILNQTKLILDAANSLTINYEDIGPGGQLKPGYYRYYFSYLTDDFNETEIVGQSGPCQVFFGSGERIRGGSDTEVTPNRVRLTLSNLDTKFTYLQVYFTYIGGEDVEVKQTLRMSQPIRVTGSNMLFTHSGIEEVDEIPIDELGIDFANIKSAKVADAVRGYLFLGGITEQERVSQEIKDFAATIGLVGKVKEFDISSDLYKDPENIYKYTGYFGGESYIFGMVGKYKGGGYTPVFPIQGYDHVELKTTDVDGEETGVYRFPYSEEEPIIQDGKIRVKHVEAYFYSEPSDTIKEVLSEIFIVRAERQNSSLVAQGAILPTVSSAPIDYRPGHEADEETYYELYGTETSKYKYFPLLDGLVECYRVDGYDTLPDYYVTDENNIKVNNNLIYAFGNKHADHNNAYQLDKWAFYSPEAMIDSAKVAAAVSTISELKRIGTIQFNVTDQIQITNYLKQLELGGGFDLAVGEGDGGNTGVRYEFSDLNVLAQDIDVISAEAISEGTFASGSDFISKMAQTLEINEDVLVKCYLSALPYIGIQLSGSLGNRSASSPAGVQARVAAIDPDDVDIDGAMYNYQNLGTTVPGAYLVNLYSSTPLTNPWDYYPNRDSIPFSQVSARWKLTDTLPNGVDIFDGDCYIGKVYQRMYTSGYRDPQEATFDGSRSNLDLGCIFSFFSESSRNPHLRHRYFANDSDLEKSTFYPFDKDYRAQRYADSQIISPGYRAEVGDFTQLPNPILLPDSKSSFYTRVFPSSQHIPNSFENGFRIFTTGWQDYPTNYGKLTRIVGYSTDLLMIFEHGIGITPVRPRVVTGQDIAGEAYLKSEGTITDAFGVVSSQYGSQDPLAIRQTPHFVYGIDRQEGKIWRIGLDKKFDIISDGVIASKLQNIIEPRIGYDAKRRLVYFSSGTGDTAELTNNDFCYIYSEDLGKFVSRSDNSGEFFSGLSTDGMFAFNDNEAYLYQNSTTLFGKSFESSFEFTINDKISLTKVFDYLNIVSNNVSPKSIILTAYNSDGTINQQAVINQGTNYYTQEPIIFYRDKRWVAQVPKVSSGTYKELENWALENRLRDKYVVCKVSYDNSNLDFETLAVQTFYRISQS